MLNSAPGFVMNSAEWQSVAGVAGISQGDSFLVATDLVEQFQRSVAAVFGFTLA